MGLMTKFKTFFTDVDEYEYVEEEVETEDVPTATTRQERRHNQNVVSLQAMKTSSKVVLCEPESYNEAQDIADHIVNRRSVIINLQRVDHSEAKRIIDFMGGTVYALSGEMQKLGPETFLCTPDNVDVSGKISGFLEDDLEKRW